MDITWEQIEDYMREPVRCVGCGSEWITGDSVRVDGGMACQDIHCNECGLAWVDEYAICNVAYVRRT